MNRRGFFTGIFGGIVGVAASPLIDNVPPMANDAPTITVTLDGKTNAERVIEMTDFRNGCRPTSTLHRLGA